MLKVRKLDSNAILPQVAHPGEDLGYDLYALEDTVLPYGEVTKVRTGVAAAAYDCLGTPLGLLIRDRSSMAAKGIVTSAGVIDSGYRGEIIVLMTAHKYERTEWVSTDHEDFRVDVPYKILAGDKIAQMLPIEILTGGVEEVTELTDASRGADGFGSSGK